MDFVLEVLFEFILEGSMEICKSKTANVVLRALSFLFLVFFFGGFFLLFTVLGIVCFKNSVLAGIFILFVELALLVLGGVRVYNFYQEYKVKK